MNRIAAAALRAALALPPLASRADDAAAIWHRSLTASLHIAADGTWQERQSWDVRADTDAAARVAANQSFGFSSGLERTTLLEAYTRKPDGTVLAVAPDAVLDRTLAAGGDDFPSFSDWRVRTIIFPDVEAGDTVHYVLLLRSRRPLFPGAYEATLTGGPQANVTAADIAISLPAAMHLAVATGGLTEDPPVREGDLVRRHWHLATAADGPEGEVRLQVSTFASYAALGDAFAARALPAAAPSEAIRGLAGRLTAGLASRRAQVARLYAYVAGRIRYVGIQYGTGRVVPDDAAAIARRGYGDCKDHVALLQALLAAKGIFSEPALVSTKARFAMPEPPTLALLDHVLLFVPEFDRYLDPTSPYAASGTLPFEDYDKPVVLAGAGGARLARTPPLLPGTVATETRTEARIAADGSVIGGTVTTASGPAAVMLRQVAAGIEEDGGESTADDDLRRLGTPGRGDFTFAPPRDSEGVASGYTLRAEFRLPSATADTGGGRFPVPAGLPVLVRGGAFLVSERPVRDGRHLCYAGREVEAIHLQLPPGAAVGDLPRDVRAAGGAAEYRADYSAAAGAITVRREFVLATLHPLCTDAEYDAIRPVLRAMRRDLDAQLSLRQAPAIAAAPPAISAASGRCAGGNAGCRPAAGEAVGGPQEPP